MLVDILAPIPVWPRNGATVRLCAASYSPEWQGIVSHRRRGLLVADVAVVLRQRLAVDVDHRLLRDLVIDVLSEADRTRGVTAGCSPADSHNHGGTTPTQLMTLCVG